MPCLAFERDAGGGAVLRLRRLIESVVEIVSAAMDPRVPGARTHCRERITQDRAGFEPLRATTATAVGWQGAHRGLGPAEFDLQPTTTHQP